MKYMLLLAYAPEAAPAEGSPEAAAEYQAWMDYTDAMAAAGVLVSGEALHGNESATTVTVRGGDRITTDGPYAEAKEVLGGFYVIDVADLDAAVDWAAKAPHIGYGAVELRPVMDVGMDPNTGHVS